MNYERSWMHAAPRSAIAVALVLYRLPFRGSTYRGLALALGISSSSAIRKSVSRARAAGLVTVEGTGAGALAVIRLTNLARAEFRKMGL